MCRQVPPEQQSTEELVKYQRAGPPGPITLLITRDSKPTIDMRGVPTLKGCLTKPRAEWVKADSTNP